jgi:uncharacterized protein DUF3311
MNSDRAVGRATLPSGAFASQRAGSPPPFPPQVTEPLPPAGPPGPPLSPFLPPPPEVAYDRPRHPAWHWLLLIPITLPLLTPLYNRLEPRLLGLPFFYWCQMAFVFVDIGIITLVYQVTKRRS